MFKEFLQFSFPIFMSISTLILIVAYLVWLERKVAARIQSRIGPYLVGKPHGWLQPLADALKLMIKDDSIPNFTPREASVLQLVAEGLMNKEIAIQMDDLSKIDYDYDTSFMIAIEAQKRGYKIFYYNPHELFMDRSNVKARGYYVKLVEDKKSYYSYLTEKIESDLSEFKFIFLRQDPPFDMNYITTTYILDCLPKKTIVINNPSAVRNSTEKIYTFQFKQYMAPTIITQKLADIKKYMRNSLEISVASANKTADKVQHVFYMVQAKDRYEVVKRIADMNPSIYGIVFCRTRRETKEVANKLMYDNYNADTIHGELSQAQRDDVMSRFRKRKIQILVATDVAARGLDVEDLTHVINYNFPDDDEIYIHRSGRTGRAGKKGISIVIIHEREIRKLKNIERISGITFSKKLVPNGLEICKKRLYALIDKIEKVEVNENQIEPFLPYIYEKLNLLDREKLIKHFVSAEFNRYLSYYKNSRDINVKLQKKENNKKKKSNRRKFFNANKNNKRYRKKKR